MLYCVFFEVWTEVLNIERYVVGFSHKNKIL
jgi:hypothetical protein